MADDLRFEKVACTGGSGRLGRYLVEELRERCDLTVIDLIPTLELLRERYGRLPEIRRPEIFERLRTGSILDSTHAREKRGFEPTRHWRDMRPAPAA